MTDVRTDFCVVGGGPAGMTVALLLLRSGASVAVMERSRSLDREFRGDILQPGGMRLLDDLGVLAGARERGSHEHDGFQLAVRGKVLMDSDYRKLPGPFNCLLSLPQRHLLEAMLAECERHDGFRYLSGCRATGLLSDGPMVRGVISEGAHEQLTVLAHCVIAADGRYSKVRKLAGIADGRLDVFDQDILWFKLPVPGELPRKVRVYQENGNVAISYASVPGSIQLGWTLPHGGYRDLAAEGIGSIKDRLRAAIPPYADLIGEGIKSMRDVTLLDVFSGCAEVWARDGLVLIGDSAHTHSPIGAQGINLAIQDAVLLHPLLMASLREKDASTAFLGRFEVLRRPDISRVMKLQVMQSKGMLSAGGFAAGIRPLAARVVTRTPIYRKVLGTLAFGNRDIRVASHLFTSRPIPA